MTTLTNSDTKIGEIVASDIRAAAVFREAGIDFCCGGNKSLADACREKGADVSALRHKLQELGTIQPAGIRNFNDWDLSFLCDYIVNTHHQYVLKTLPELLLYTRKIADVHGSHHPELIEAALLFAKINEALLQHLSNEEQVLFPAVREWAVHGTTAGKAVIISGISRMVFEHDFAGGAMDKINALTQGYQVPEDACNTYRVALKVLEQFEDDLHIHVHLENNILFPKSLKLAN